MPTPTFFTGFEHKIVAACGGSVVPAEAQLWDTIAGTPAVETTIVHHGGAALRCNPAAATEYVSLGFAAGVQRKVGSIAVRFESLPSGGGARIVSAAAAVGGCIIGVTVGGFWFAEAGGGSLVTLGTGPSVGVWYIIDFDFNTSANPNTTDWRIDGTAQTQATGATAAQDMTAFRFGTTLSTTADFVVDCAVLSDTAGDYPLGHYKTLGYLPNADDDITQVGAGAFVDGAAGAISGANPAWDNLLDLVGGTTRVEQTAIAGTGYIEVGFADSAEASAPIAVMAEVAMRADSATTTNGQVQIDDAGTLDTFTGLFDPSEATNVNRWKCLATKPTGGAWTDAAFDGLSMRIGYSTDANPDVWFVGLMYEALFADAAATFGIPFGRNDARYVPLRDSDPWNAKGGWL